MRFITKQWKTCLYGHLQETSANYCKFDRDGCPCAQPLKRIGEKEKKFNEESFFR